MWRDTRDLILVLDLSSLVLTDMPLSADILRDYTLEFEIRVEGPCKPKRVFEGGC